MRFRNLVELYAKLHNTQRNYLMAASRVVMLPVLAAFYVLQRYFLRGISIFAGINR